MHPLQFQTPALLVLLALITLFAPAPAAADSMTSRTWCSSFGSCDSSNATWHIPTITNDDGVTILGADFPVSANEGCRDPSKSVPGMIRICVDWGRKRGHFIFGNDGRGKRCFIKTKDDETNWDDRSCGGDNGIRCWVSEWEEAKCSW